MADGVGLDFDGLDQSIALGSGSLAQSLLAVNFYTNDFRLHIFRGLRTSPGVGTTSAVDTPASAFRKIGINKKTAAVAAVITECWLNINNW